MNSKTLIAMIALPILTFGAGITLGSAMDSNASSGSVDLIDAAEMTQDWTGQMRHGAIAFGQLPQTGEWGGYGQIDEEPMASADCQALLEDADSMNPSGAFVAFFCAPTESDSDDGLIYFPITIDFDPAVLD